MYIPKLLPISFWSIFEVHRPMAGNMMLASIEPLNQRRSNPCGFAGPAALWQVPGAAGIQRQTSGAKFRASDADIQTSKKRGRDTKCFQNPNMAPMELALDFMQTPLSPGDSHQHAS